MSRDLWDLVAMFLWQTAPQTLIHELFVDCDCLSDFLTSLSARDREVTGVL